MPREGTRSQTGNSKPRVFPTVDTAPAITRKKTTKPKAKVAPVAKGAKPTGVTKKKKAAPKKEPGVVAKVRAPPRAGSLDALAHRPARCRGTRAARLRHAPPLKYTLALLLTPVSDQSCCEEGREEDRGKDCQASKGLLFMSNGYPSLSALATSACFQSRLRPV